MKASSAPQPKERVSALVLTEVLEDWSCREQQGGKQQGGRPFGHTGVIFLCLHTLSCAGFLLALTATPTAQQPLTAQPAASPLEGSRALQTLMRGCMPMYLVKHALQCQGDTAAHDVRLQSGDVVHSLWTGGSQVATRLKQTAVQV
jgi:hypothetical protein